MGAFLYLSKMKNLYLVVILVLIATTQSCKVNKDKKKDEPVAFKPVIYLYPETITESTVSLNFNGSLTETWPEYGSGWQVSAHPDGTLFNKVDGKRHRYLFYEGTWNAPTEITQGFCASREDLPVLLEKKLLAAGMSDLEINDCITFWMGVWNKSPFWSVQILTDMQVDIMSTIQIEPKPETFVRVFLLMQPSATMLAVPEQEIILTTRKGYTAVEWGGTVLPPKRTKS